MSINIRKNNYVNDHNIKANLKKEKGYYERRNLMKGVCIVFNSKIDLFKLIA